MEFIEFVEKIAEQENIVLLHYQKEIIRKIDEARKEGKEIKEVKDDEKRKCIKTYRKNYR